LSIEYIDATEEEVSLVLRRVLLLRIDVYDVTALFRV
jgi:hypothetical protein